MLYLAQARAALGLPGDATLEDVLRAQVLRLMDNPEVVVPQEVMDAASHRTHDPENNNKLIKTYILQCLSSQVFMPEPVVNLARHLRAEESHIPIC